MFTLLIACIVEAIFGYSKFIYNQIKHPVVWMGAVISFLEKNCNKTHSSRITGIFAIAVLLVTTLAVTIPIQKYGNIYIETILMASLLAFRSLYEHVNAVYQAVKQKNLETARFELAKIVGRDTEHLDESEICKAAIESLAESFSDGVAAPLFWATCFGLSGIACYKAINTADSMIGHKTPRHQYFGWAAARLDDVANFIPARLSAIFIALCHPVLVAGSGNIKMIIKAARKHASPNSGYPEAAMAYALGICLGGKRSYDGEEYQAPLIGEGLRTEITINDLQKALKIYVTACAALWLILLILATALY